MIGASDAYSLTNPEANCASFLGLGDFRYVGSVSNLSNGDKIMIGDESLTVISSPGHSVGSVCYYAPGILLSGDTIFAEGGIGRTDLYGGDEEVLRSSIATLIDLPPKTVVYPGHGPKTTVKELTFFHRYFL
jgi:glyoxylase-like metal-dependent hydrolase (beta-lactamase superfamily II)